MTDTRLCASGLVIRYGQRTVVPGLDLELPAGRVTAIVGPNASGKSTVLRALARVLAPAAGRVLLDGVPIEQVATKEVARRVAMLPQTPIAPDGITVGDLVARGRWPHRSMTRAWSDRDQRHVDHALAVTGTADLRHRLVAELSGGQRQRVWLALVLAQDTAVLLLDEPTTYLDLAHQLAVLDLVRDRNRTAGTTVAIVLHDLNHAGRYADHLVVIDGGRVVADGSPVEVLTPEVLERHFGVEAVVIDDPQTGTPLVVARSSGPSHRAPPARAAR